ncbi:alpha/beta fold hydrolase [Allosphingosinicella deserti]|uniref:Alpha/beta hydrolase n=1 Tax=Allosphingosinicella deserti TaxID=2116704 RepID=A0A2P7QZM9_9SPHN|nr:alpha/beta hydrolase [Sphingomonas deserti]PSJ43409.1 alpha/beta hydrolase [Sphingomonas deserti]
MSTITTQDGTTIFYKDWGAGQPIVFSHGWPLAGDAWDHQMMFFGTRGFRVIAHDRRGHGRSEQTWHGNNMDQYADDLSDLLEQLDLDDVILIGHSTGGGEVARYIGRHGTARVAKAVLLAAVPPIMVKSDHNPEGTPIEVFHNIRAGTLKDRATFFKELSMPFYGFNREGASIAEGLRDTFELMGVQAGIKAAYDCIREFSETDFTEDLKKIDVPTLVAHGEDDQIVPIEAAAYKTIKLVPNGTLRTYPGGSHGMAQVTPDDFNQDVLDFIRG